MEYEQKCCKYVFEAPQFLALFWNDFWNNKMIIILLNMNNIALSLANQI